MRGPNHSLKPMRTAALYVLGWAAKASKLYGHWCPRWRRIDLTTATVSIWRPGPVGGCSTHCEDRAHLDLRYCVQWLGTKNVTQTDTSAPMVVSIRAGQMIMQRGVTLQRREEEEVEER